MVKVSWRFPPGAGAWISEDVSAQNVDMKIKSLRGAGFEVTSDAVPVNQPRMVEEEAERAPGITIGDGVTLKDFMDLRDLRLMLWNLRTQLAERFSIPDAGELANKLIPVIERKIEEVKERVDRGHPV